MSSYVTYHTGRRSMVAEFEAYGLKSLFWPMNSLRDQECICKDYRDWGFSREQPTRCANSEAALRSALLRNTVLFSPAIRVVAPALP